MNMNAAQIDPSQAIGQIAVSLPGATAIFRRLKLDFCCGGQLPLAEAVAAKGLNLDEVVKALNAMGATPQDLLVILQAMKSAGALNAEIEVI